MSTVKVTVTLGVEELTRVRLGDPQAGLRHLSGPKMVKELDENREPAEPCGHYLV